MATLLHEMILLSQYSLVPTLSRLSCWIFSFVSAYSAIVAVCLSMRYLGIRFGKRLSADGGRRGIVITGATSGLGLEAAKRFYELGFTVFACYYNDKEGGYKELSELGSNGSSHAKNKNNVFLVQMDVRSQESIERSSKEIDELSLKHQVKLFCLINNAGIAKVGPFEWGSRGAIRDTVETNVTGVMLVTRQFLYRIIENKGRVVNVSSALLYFPVVTGTVYGASKSAIAYFSESLNEDLRLYGASCHCILPDNHMTSSNIMYPLQKSSLDAEKELTDGERTMYERSFKRYMSWLRTRLRKMQLSEKDPAQIANIYQLDTNKLQFKTQQHSRDSDQKNKNKSLMAQLLVWLFANLTSDSAGLAKSGVIDAYEQAVCLKSPPRNLFAGNTVFTHIMGPSLEYVPHSVHRLMARLFSAFMTK